MRKRNQRVVVYFTKDELEALSKKVKKSGLSREGYLRAILAGSTVKEAPPADVPYLLRAMRQNGYNLDQILKRVNSGNILDMPQFRKDLEDLRAATRLVFETYTTR